MHALEAFCDWFGELHPVVGVGLALAISCVGTAVIIGVVMLLTGQVVLP